MAGWSSSTYSNSTFLGGYPPSVVRWIGPSMCTDEMFSARIQTSPHWTILSLTVMILAASSWASSFLRYIQLNWWRWSPPPRHVASRRHHVYTLTGAGGGGGAGLWPTGFSPRFRFAHSPMLLQAERLVDQRQHGLLAALLVVPRDVRLRLLLVRVRHHFEQPGVRLLAQRARHRLVLALAGQLRRDRADSAVQREPGRVIPRGVLDPAVLLDQRLGVHEHVRPIEHIRLDVDETRFQLLDCHPSLLSERWVELRPRRTRTARRGLPQ